MDLTPRPVAPSTPSRPRRRRSPLAVAGVLLVMALIGGVLVRQLFDSTSYYYNADRAVAERDELGDRNFRIQGAVQDDVRQSGDGVVTFAIAFNEVVVDVRHVGDPPDLFRPGIGVVLEGRWAGETFASERIMVKHSSEYKAENPDRVSPDEP